MTATSFGPFHGDVLELADGFTIVFGPNEAGKSSWHAATYSALCGMRRGKGQLRSGDVHFANLHRPWHTTSGWKVGCNIELDNGKSIEVTWDLDDRVGTAFDDLGRDVTVPLNDGSIDLASLVGLDRTSFLATACVRQTELLSVRDDPNALQEHLQRAAATGSGDATAAGALQTLADYRRDRVGLLRANSNKPWQSSKRRVESARAALDNAHAGQKARLELAVGLQRAQREAEGIGALMALTEAALSLSIARHDLDVARAAAEDHGALSRRIEERKRRIADLIARRDVLAAAIDAAEAHRAGEAAAHEVETIQALTAQLETAQTDVATATARIEIAQFALANIARRRQCAALGDADRAVDAAETCASVAAEELASARAARAAAAAAAAADEAESLRRVADRVRALERSAPEGAAEMGDLEAAAREVVVALDAWEARPTVAVLTGPASAELRSQLAELPPSPVGDLAPRAEVEEAERTFADATARLDGHAAGRPPVLEVPIADEGELRRLAEDLAADAPDLEGAQRQVADARAAAARVNAPTRRVGLVAVGASVMLVGLLLAVLVTPAAAALAVVGAVTAALGMRRGGVPELDQDAVAHLASVEAGLDRAKTMAHRRAAAAERATQLGLEVSAVALRRAADAVAAGRIAQENLDRWASQQAVHAESVEVARRVLGDALVAVGAGATGDIGRDLENYKHACAARAGIAAEAGQRAALEARLAAQEAAEDGARKSIIARESAANRMRAAASLAGVEESDPDSLVASLQQWLAAHDARQAASEHARDEQRELAQLLAGRSVEDLEALARDAESRADSLTEAARAAGASPVPAEQRGKLIAELPRLDAAVADAIQAEAAARGGTLAAARAALDSLETEPVLPEPNLDVETQGKVTELAVLGAGEATGELTEAEAALGSAKQMVAQLRGQLQERPALPTDAVALRRVSELARQALAAAITAHPQAAAAVSSEGLAVDCTARTVLPSVVQLAAARDEGERERQQAEQERAELEGRLASDDSHLPDIEGADQRVQDADVCLGRLRDLHRDFAGDFEVATVLSRGDLEESLPKLEARRTAALECAAETRGELSAANTGHVPVAAAEEELASRIREHERLSRLDAILVHTTTYLENAQDRVHHEIAPRLAASAQQWLPPLFGDRYQRVVVDPQHLVVKVGRFGEEPRDATLLSHGTAEQLFLLLRLALVEHLTKASGESCPLLLDDITAHFDDVRESSILDVLHGVSREQQVVLFTQEDSVRSWAERHFDTARDSIVTLSLTG